jgi:hypothetical protein
MGQFFQTLKAAASDFIKDDCMSSGAAIAYYSIFALPPLLVLAFMFAGYLGIAPDEISRVAKEQIGVPPIAPEKKGNRTTMTSRLMAHPLNSNQSQIMLNRARYMGLGQSDRLWDYCCCYLPLRAYSVSCNTR